MAKGIFYWGARFLAIAYVFFLASFSLDIFKEGSSFAEAAADILAHNIPSLFFVLLLAIAWKREDIGGLLFVASSFFWLLFFVGSPAGAIFNPVSLPPIIIGLLFILSFKNKKEKL
ncbi:MAG: hypothetical protein PHI77_02330 [Candidatus Pacebacteria bacterium]|nr:hypothetical protein [Candidatus Paceibacterota bacterium]MDD4830924.1 hypothetical protein [Candidatus Paceibacterota bacterium]MDD4875223.1 hypothetical protein [Candidatus Paceibacterota bacterium]